MTWKPAPPGPNWPRPADPEIYPDLAAAGSLAGALARTAAELGLDLGELVISDSDPLQWVGVASTVAQRDPCGIIVALLERFFIVKGWSQGVQMFVGKTPDLAAAARAANAWRHGAKVREIHAVPPFIEITGLAVAHEHGPADAVTVQWRLILEELRAFDYANTRTTLKLAEIAVTDPTLRWLYPFTSHWSLNFSTCTGHPYSRDIPSVDPLEAGRYRVREPLGTVIGEADTPEQAFALLMSALPAGLGPAVAGTTED